MARLYWRLKRHGKWTWQPVKFKRLTEAEIVRELIFYDKIHPPEEEE